MAPHDIDLPEDDLSRTLRRELRAVRAPEPWVHRALAVSRELPAPPRESRWPVILPHLAGLALLVGLAVALLLRPDAGRALFRMLAGAGITGAPFRFPPLSHEMILAWISTPILIFLLVQGSRGFPVLHRR